MDGDHDGEWLEIGSGFRIMMVNVGDFNKV